MRIKVESRPPLPNIKAWFTTGSTGTISDLKTRLCADLPAFQDSEVQVADILLEVDEFELLDGSSIDVMRDGDLVIMKRNVTRQPLKRKADTVSISEPLHKRSKHTVAPLQVVHVPTPLAKPAAGGVAKRARSASTSSSSASESSSSSDEQDSDKSSCESSSDSESSSDAESTSDSDASSTSSAPSPPERATTSVPTNPVPQTKTKPKAQSEVPHIPPGYGKPTTHSRNLRRRRKRMFERLEATAEPASVNAIPLGARAAQAVVEVPDKDVEDVPTQREPQPQFMMASLQNKNKRKGFKDALYHGVPPKIIFAEPAPGCREASQDMPFAQQADEHVRKEAVVRQRPFARLIPPSEKQEAGVLPPNMFVTSVDVEAGLWSGKKKRKGKKAQAQKDWEEQKVEEEVVLQYDEEHTEEAGLKDNQGGEKECGSLDKADVEKRWPTLPKLTSPEQIREGSTVAWKALGIHPVLYTPELLTYLGPIRNLDAEQLTVELLSEAAVQLSFGGVSVDEDAEGPVQETVSWVDVTAGDWRIVG